MQRDCSVSAMVAAREGGYAKCDDSNSRTNACCKSVGVTMEDHLALQLRFVGERNKEGLPCCMLAAMTTEGLRATAERAAAARCCSASSRKMGYVLTPLPLIFVFKVAPSLMKFSFILYSALTKQ